MAERLDQTGSTNEFSDNVDRWGVDLTQWPDEQAERARALLKDSTEAQRLLASAQRLQTLLLALPEVTAPVELTARIAARPPADAWDAISAWFKGSLWRPVLAGSLPLLVGFALGFTMTVNPNDEMADQISLLSLTTSFEDFTDDL